MDIFKKKFWKKFMVPKKSNPPPEPAPPSPVPSRASPAPLTKKTKSWVWTRTQSFSTVGGETPERRKRSIRRQGCFTVYVGPQKQRFLVKTESASHPLFRALLDTAEMEYGFKADGPIMLPCDVDLFYRVLAEIDYENGGDDDDGENYDNSILAAVAVP